MTSSMTVTQYCTCLDKLVMQLKHQLDHRDLQKYASKL